MRAHYIYAAAIHYTFVYEYECIVYMMDILVYNNFEAKTTTTKKRFVYGNFWK